IRADREISGTKVIFLTGKNDKNSISSAMALKPEGYLLKPIEKKQLDAAVEATLSGKSANLSL
ncbi:MAG: response regulator, partial [Lachnospiraceae bacterium]|nr:response regulator [Lachnospiraceae bacterium]